MTMLVPAKSMVLEMLPFEVVGDRLEDEDGEAQLKYLSSCLCCLVTCRDDSIFFH